MGKNKLEKRYSKWGYIFVIPFVAAFLIFNFWPFIRTFYLAFTNLKGSGNMNPDWLVDVGKPWYKNFADVFGSPTFRKAMSNTILFWLGEFAPELIVGFWLASMITDRRMKIKGKKLFETIYFFPKLVSGVTLGKLFIIVAEYLIGNLIEGTYMISMMDGFGFEIEDFMFLQSTWFWIIVLNIFMHFGSTFIYIITGLAGIPIEVFEAAEIDGANRFQTFIKVTLPCMRPMVLFILVFSLVDGFGMFDVPMQFGGEFNLLNENTTLMIYIHMQAMNGSYNIARASAASIILTFFFLILAAVAFYAFRDRDEEKLRKRIKQERKEDRLRKQAAA